MHLLLDWIFWRVSIESKKSNIRIADSKLASVLMSLSNNTSKLVRRSEHVLVAVSSPISVGLNFLSVPPLD